MNGSIIWGMVIDMNEPKLTRVEQLRGFLAGTAAVEFRPPSGNAERYGHIVSVLRRFHYAGLRRAEKGVVLHYLSHIPGNR